MSQTNRNTPTPADGDADEADEAIIGLFSDAARRQADEAAGPGPSPEIWHRLQARRAATDQAAGVARRRVWILAIAGAAAAVALGIGWRRFDRPLTYAVAAPALEQDGYVRGTGPAGTEVRFSDGTRIRVADAGRLSVLGRGRRGARLRVEEGRARFEVVPRPGAAWVVEAGPFSVDVTGTVFDVRWSGADETVEVSLRSGAVRVRGPLIREQAVLRPGQRLTARLAAGELTIGGGEPARPTAPVPPPPAGSAGGPTGFPSAEAAPAPAPPTLVAPPAPSRRARAKVALQPPEIGDAAAPAPDPTPWAPERWPARLAAGDAAGVVAEAEGQGLERAFTEADAGALAALADAARYRGRPELATAALLSVRRRFPATTSALAAAFLLGRLADDRQERAEALSWYDRYLGEAPRGPYAPEALGRKMLAIERLSGREAARAIAAEYLRRFPDGTYLLQARSILAGP